MEPMVKWPKIPRLNREMILTEKIDGTNAQVYVFNVNPSDHMKEDFAKKGWAILRDGWSRWAVVPASRNRYLTFQKDNFGFAEWVYDNCESLIGLGPGRHYGEYWGSGIQRTYGRRTKRFSLFNVSRYEHSCDRPACCDVVPKLYEGPFCQDTIDFAVDELRDYGSFAAPGFMDPEGIVVFHEAASQLFKITCEGDEKPKGKNR